MVVDVQCSVSTTRSCVTNHICALSLFLFLSFFLSFFLSCLHPSLSLFFLPCDPIKVNPHVIHKAKTRMEKDKNEKNHLAQRFIGQLLPSEITQVGREDMRQGGGERAIEACIEGKNAGPPPRILPPYCLCRVILAVGVAPIGVDIEPLPPNAHTHVY